MKLIGHQQQRKGFESLWRKDQLSAPLLLLGPSGVGKSLVARELARSLFCDQNNEVSDESIYGGCGECHGCTVFDAGNCPDFISIDCQDKDQWGVEEVRKLLYSLHLSPFSGSWRFVLFNNAEFMSVHIGNTLLKILEEPRKGTLFGLVSSSESRLLPTLVSRCHSWYFHLLANAEVNLILDELKRSGQLPEKQVLSPEDMSLLADGSLAQVLKVSEHAELWKILKASLSAISRGDTVLAIKLAEDLKKDRERLRVALVFIRIIARQAMLQPSPRRRRATWARCVDNSISAEYLIFERNINASLILEELFLSLVPESSLNSFTFPQLDAKLLSDLVTP